MTQSTDPREGEVREALAEQTALVDRLLSAVERIKQDIGCELPSAVLPLLGPANDKARAVLSTPPAPSTGLEELRKGLRLAIIWFDEYALMHRAKGTAEGNDKGQRNQDRADQLRALLNAPEHRHD